MTDEQEGAWLTIPEAAVATGISEKALRSRIKRRTLQVRPGRRANDGRVRIYVTPDLRADHERTLPVPGPDNGPADVSSDALVKIARLEEALIHVTRERDRLRDEVITVRDDGDRRLAEQRERHEAEVGRLHELLRVAVQQPGPTPPAPSRLSWWRRPWFS